MVSELSFLRNKRQKNKFKKWEKHICSNIMFILNKAQFSPRHERDFNLYSV